MAEPSRRYPTPRCNLCRRPIRQRVGLRVFLGLPGDLRSAPLLGRAVHAGCFQRMIVGFKPYAHSGGALDCDLCGEKGPHMAVNLVYFDKRGSFREGPGLVCHLDCIRELLAQPGGLEILMLRESG